MDDVIWVPVDPRPGVWSTAVVGGRFPVRLTHRNPFGPLVLFPRLFELECRVRGALRVLRYGDDEW